MGGIYGEIYQKYYSIIRPVTCWHKPNYNRYIGTHWPIQVLLTMKIWLVNHNVNNFIITYNRTTNFSCSELFPSIIHIQFSFSIFVWCFRECVGNFTEYKSSCSQEVGITLEWRTSASLWRTSCPKCLMPFKTLNFTPRTSNLMQYSPPLGLSIKSGSNKDKITFMHWNFYKISNLPLISNFIKKMLTQRGSSPWVRGHRRGLVTYDNGDQVNPFAFIIKLRKKNKVRVF
jgi:hypothetical protein